MALSVRISSDSKKFKLADRVGVIPLLSGDDTSHNGAAEQPIPLLTHDVPSEMLAPSFMQPHYGDPQLIQSAVSGDKRPKVCPHHVVSFSSCASQISKDSVH